MEPVTTGLILLAALAAYAYGYSPKKKGSSKPKECPLFISQFAIGSTLNPEDPATKAIFIEEARRIRVGLPSLRIASPNVYGPVISAGFDSDRFKACFDGVAIATCSPPRRVFTDAELFAITGAFIPGSDMAQTVGMSPGDLASYTEDVLFGRTALDLVNNRALIGTDDSLAAWLTAVACASPGGIAPPPGSVIDTETDPLAKELEGFLTDDNAEPDDLRALAAKLDELYPDAADMLRTRADELEAIITSRAYAAGGWQYRIKKNDTPYGLAVDYGSGDPRPIRVLNNLSVKTVNGVTLYTPFNPNQSILLPLDWARPRKTDPAHPGPGLTSPCEALAKKRYQDAYNATMGQLGGGAGPGDPITGQATLGGDLAATAAGLAAATMARLECEGVTPSTYYPPTSYPAASSGGQNSPYPVPYE